MGLGRRVSLWGLRGGQRRDRGVWGGPCLGQGRPRVIDCRKRQVVACRLELGQVSERVEDLGGDMKRGCSGAVFKVKPAVSLERGLGKLGACVGCWGPGPGAKLSVRTAGDRRSAFRDECGPRPGDGWEPQPGHGHQGSLGGRQG